MTIINSWVQGIILAVIIATIIEIILPEGNNKKYIKTVIGIYILFVMIHPLISKVSNKNINIDKVVKDTTSKMNEYKTEDLSLETNKYIKETYLEKIKEDINKKIEEKGYDINFLNLDIEIENEEFYGEIKSIDIGIDKKEIETEENISENTIQKIDTVEINISNKTIVNEENEKITEDEIISLKEYLSNEYGTAKEKIYING